MTPRVDLGNERKILNGHGRAGGTMKVVIVREPHLDDVEREIPRWSLLWGVLFRRTLYV